MKNIKEINPQNLLYNLSRFGGKKICAMVKANAYGHGTKEIVSLLKDRVEMFGVSSVEEGVEVRKICETPVFVVAKTDEFKLCKKYNLDVIVEDENDVKAIAKYGLNCHVKINSGMNRYGIKTSLAAKILNDALNEYEVFPKSICTHFSKTDDKFVTQNEYQRFLKLRACFSQKLPVCFGGSNIAAYNFDFDILRLGIGLYGYESKGLKPVMLIKSFVRKIFYARAGEFVGYENGFMVKKSGFFAVVPVGYADGLVRYLSNKFCVEINSKKYRAIGNICMDCFFVEIDSVVKVGDEVIVLKNAQDFAKKSKTISYEILTNFSKFRGETEILGD